MIKQSLLTAGADRNLFLVLPATVIQNPEQPYFPFAVPRDDFANRVIYEVVIAVPEELSSVRTISDELLCGLRSLMSGAETIIAMKNRDSHIPE